MLKTHFSAERRAHCKYAPARAADWAVRWVCGCQHGQEAGGLGSLHTVPGRLQSVANVFDLQQGGNSKARPHDRQGSSSEANGLWAGLDPASAWMSLLLSWDWRPVSSQLITTSDVAMAARWARGWGGATSPCSNREREESRTRSMGQGWWASVWKTARGALHRVLLGGAELAGWGLAACA